MTHRASESDSQADRTPRWWQRTGVALILVFVLAASLRLGWLAVSPDSVPFAGLAAVNGEVAHNIVTHDRWFVVNAVAATPKPSVTLRGPLVDPADLDYRVADSHPHYEQQVLEPPGPALLLAGIWSITGDQRFVYLQVIQLVIDSFMAVLVYWLTLKLFRRRSAAFLAGVLYALYIPLALVARIPHGDAWAGFATIIALALYLKSRESPRAWLWLIAVGVILGLGAYMRPTVLILPVAFALAALPWSGWRRSAAVAVIPLVAAALLLLPWTVRNFEVFHAFVPVRTSLGWTLWVGLGELPNDFGALGTDANAVETALRDHPDLAVGSPKFDKVLVDRSLSAISAHPFFYAKLVGRRLLQSTVIPTTTNTTKSSRLLGLLSFGQPILFIVALVTGVLICLRRPAQRVNVALLAAVAIGTVLPFVVIHLEARFIVAASFVYIILAACGLTVAASRVFDYLNAGRASATRTPEADIR
jgi:4-amino-4-deoxy-L-arabinose transferase-like glycosyltransferase